jgi:hypothetical protein
MWAWVAGTLRRMGIGLWVKIHDRPCLDQATKVALGDRSVVLRRRLAVPQIHSIKRVAETISRSS